MARHLNVLNRNLVDLALGRIKRLIVQMPPRHGKSELCSKHFPPWYLGWYPHRNVILTSATDDLAMDFSSAARDLLREHGHLWGVKLREDRGSVQRWQTTKGGGLRAAGVGGGIMGRGADLLIIDDYFKNVEAALSETQRVKLYQWYLSTSGTRLSPTGAVLIIATRWHKQDLIGQVLTEAEQTGEEWKVVSFPAIGNDGAALWPEQWPIETMESKRSGYVASGYPWMWEALYQQTPPEALDAKWPPSYFGESIYFDEWPDESELVWKVTGVDPSLGKGETACYSAIINAAMAKNGQIYIHADLDRRDVRGIVRDLRDHDRWFRPHAWAVEVNAFGALREYIEDTSDGMPPNIAAVTQSKDKDIRIEIGLTNLLALGRLRFQRNSPGVALLLEQMKSFPSHKYKDGPDALETTVRVIRQLCASGMEGEPLPEAVAV